LQAALLTIGAICLATVMVCVTIWLIAMFCDMFDRR